MLSQISTARNDNAANSLAGTAGRDADRMTAGIVHARSNDIPIGKCIRQP
jgi:hypothetical protein